MGRKWIVDVKTDRWTDRWRSDRRLLVFSLDHLVMLAVLQVLGQLRVVGLLSTMFGSVTLNQTEILLDFIWPIKDQRVLSLLKLRLSRRNRMNVSYYLHHHCKSTGDVNRILLLTVTMKNKPLINLQTQFWSSAGSVLGRGPFIQSQGSQQSLISVWTWKWSSDLWKTEIGGSSLCHRWSCDQRHRRTRDVLN